MTRLLAVDPGVHSHAWGLFEGPTLVSVGMGDHAIPEADGLVIERPEYQGERSDRARTQDLINLAWSAGVLAGRLRLPTAEVPPSAWKGTEPKPICHRRLWEVLSTAERELLGGRRTGDVIDAAVRRGALSRWSKAAYPRSFPTHNILDAVALGCVILGRLQGRGR